MGESFGQRLSYRDHMEGAMKKVNILIVEDESIVANELKSTIEKLGFTVDGIASSYQSAIEHLERKHPDIVMLDINLKEEKTGIDLAHTINRDHHVPFIYLSDYTHESIMQQAIATNPVTYLAKPFQREHIQSAIMFYLYKNTHPEPHENENMTSLGHGYFYDTAARNLYYKSFPIKLSPKEKRMLELLIDAKHNIVTYQTLEYDIWEGNVVSESALRTLMYRLNARLEYKIIENVPTFGYRLRQE